MRCRGCPIDICKGKLPIGGGHIGLDRWQDNRNWQNGGEWRNDDFIDQKQKGGFMDSFQNRDFLNHGQGGLFNKKFRNGFKKRQKQRYDD